LRNAFCVGPLHPPATTRPARGNRSSDSSKLSAASPGLRDLASPRRS
jgi:hypothetical protein